MSASETLSRRATATRPAKAVPAWAGRLRAVLPGAAFCALTALLWQAMALARHSPLVPGLGEISGEIVRLLAGGMAIGQVALTLWRIVLGGAASCVIAFALALGAARSPLLRAFIRPAVLLGLTVPGLVWALLCVIWFGIGLATPVVSIILGVTPPLLVTISEGLRNIDPKLMDVARVLRLSRWSRLRASARAPASPTRSMRRGSSISSSISRWRSTASCPASNRPCREGRPGLPGPCDPICRCANIH